jgi:hypothetical protein
LYFARRHVELLGELGVLSSIERCIHLGTSRPWTVRLGAVGRYVKSKIIFRKNYWTVF